MPFWMGRRRAIADRNALESGDESASAQQACQEPDVLGPGIRVLGTVRTTTAVRVQGRVVGEVRGRVVSVMTDGVVDGDVVAYEADIQGVLRGRVIAPRVTIGPTAIIEGRVIHNSVASAEGAHLDVRMPWRPLNYFDDVISDIRGVERHEHVQS